MRKLAKQVGILRIICSLISSVVLITSFQNCGGFKADQLGSPLERTSNTTPSFAKPTLSWKVAFSQLTNQSTFQLDFQYVVDPNLSAKTVTCQVDDRAPVDCQSTSFGVTSLGDGDHLLTIVLVDSRDQSVTLSGQIRVDATAPILSLSEQPASLVGTATAKFSFSAIDVISSASDLAYQCALDTAAFSVCVSPTALAGLALGTHTYKIKAVDKAGNQSSEAVVTWTYSATAPTINLTQVPGNYSNSKVATIAFNGTSQGKAISVFQCKVDAGAYASCASPFNIANLANGAHTFSVQGQVSSGTYSAASTTSWIVDTTAPTAPVITTMTKAFSNSLSASFSFSATDSGSAVAVYQCSVNSSAFANCSSTSFSQIFGEGTNVLSVRATDLAGNLSATSTFTWVVDVTAPQLTLTQTPSNPTTATSAQFLFTSTDAGSGLASTQCQIDLSSSASCVSPLSLSSLSAGDHSLRIVATDKAGNTQSVSYSWTVSPSVLLDGKALYATNCAGCHGAIATSVKIGRTASQITAALSTISAMKSIVLSTAEIAAIAQALAPSSGGITPLAAGQKYFPITTATKMPKRIYRLTRAQLDITTQALLPSYYSTSISDVMPSDPLITNYEFAESLLFNSGNFTPLNNWLDQIVAKVRLNSSAAINCASQGNSPTCLTAAARAFTSKAFRGDVSEAKLAEFASFLVSGAAAGSIDDAVADFVDVVISSPMYLFREEFDVDAGSTLLASQQLSLLTYALADAPPEKVSLVSGNSASYLQPATKSATINNILASAEGKAKLTNFILTWLEVKKPSDLMFSTTLFPEFTSAIAVSEVNETKKFLNYFLNQATPTLRQLTQATQSFVDSNLAGVYGVTPVDPAGNQLTTLPSDQRLGIFSQAAVIASHSGTDRTRPIHRGLFFVRKVLCLPFADTPPPGVNTTLPTGNMTERQKIVSVTTSSSCLACHATMNPMGFFQENFNPFGQWRTLDNSLPIDASFSYDGLDEGPLNETGPVESLKGLTNSMLFKQCFVRQMFRYYMGRNEVPGDDPLLQQMFLAFETNDTQDILAALRTLMNSSQMMSR